MKQRFFTGDQGGTVGHTKDKSITEMGVNSMRKMAVEVGGKP